MQFIIYILILFLNTLKLGVPSSVSRFDYGEIKLFQSQESYSVESTILLNDNKRRDKEVSYKVKATLNVQPLWKKTDKDLEYLLKFDLLSPKLHSRGINVNADYLPVGSVWDSYSNTQFYAHIKNGIISEAFLNEDPADVLNLKKSLISLFQFNVFDGEGNETDVSGTCGVQYETISMDVFRKIKSRCSWGSDGDGGGENNEVTSRRVTRYTLAPGLGAIDEIYAEEVHEFAASLGDAGLKARAWLRLRRDPVAALKPLALTDGPLAAALQHLPAAMTQLPLTMQRSGETDEKLSAVQLGALLQRELEAVGGAGAGEGGTASATAAALRLLPALRAASRPNLVHLLHSRDDPDELSGLCRLLGVAGTLAAHQAAEQFLQLRHEEASLSLAQHYLEGVTLSPEPEETVVAEVLRLEELPHVAVAERALLAASAAAARLPARSPAPAAAAAALKRSLSRCKENECRTVRLRALGNLKRADTAELLLEHAERGGAAASLAALEALAALPARAVSAPQQLRRLESVALKPRALPVRAAAADLFLRLSARTPLILLPLLTALHERGPVELRRLTWQRLHTLAAKHQPVRDLLVALPLRLREWYTHAMGGTSSLLVRGVGGCGGWSAALQSVQVARGGMLQRGRVTLLTLAPDGHTDETLAVELWARGLESFASSSADAVDDDVQPADVDDTMAGGLALEVGGARLGGVTLFASQSELMGHVWAGTGSEPTPVLRALRSLPEVRETLPLMGGGALRLVRRGALALAMDAHATVSLWGRSARAGLQLRGAFAASAEASVTGAWGDLRAASTLELEPRLNIAADLDFYGPPALCVRASTTPYEVVYNVTLTSRLGAPRRSVRRSRAARHPRAGLTLALGAPNDVTCRTLGAADN